jgi:hypothetical protein
MAAKTEGQESVIFSRKTVLQEVCLESLLVFTWKKLMNTLVVARIRGAQNENPWYG